MADFFQDFTPVSVGHGSTGRPAAVPKSNVGLAQALRSGKVTGERKHAAETGNKGSSSATVMSAAKLDNTEETRHQSSGKALGAAIMQARVAKKWAQKDLATKINEKAQIVQQYEQGSAIPNPQIIQKLERALNCRLPRPGKAPKAAAGGASGGGGGGSAASAAGKVPGGGVRDKYGLTANQRAAITNGGPAGRR